MQLQSSKWSLSFPAGIITFNPNELAWRKGSGRFSEKLKNEGQVMRGA